MAKLAPRNDTCTCPPGDVYIATSCPQHFGTGYGYCIPHQVDTDTIVAAVAVRGNPPVPLCESCRKAYDKAAER